MDIYVLAMMFLRGIYVSLDDFFVVEKDGTVLDDKGNVAHWGGEFMSPNRMAKAGWSKTILKPGDQITITLFPSKLGKNFGNVANITLPNGQTRVAIAPDDAAQRSEIGKDAEPK